MLILCCGFVFGNYFCYDNPASLQTVIEKQFDVSTAQYGLLYTGYAMPNLIMPFVGGILSDKIGKRRTILMFSVIMCLGQAMVMMGGHWLSFKLMLGGRVIYGLGCEAMYVS